MISSPPSKGLLLAAAILAAWGISLVVVLSLRVGWTQFRGPQSEATLIQAETGLRLATGAGFVTGVNFPQTASVLKARGVPFEPSKPYPELHHAPLYPLVVATALTLVPSSTRERWFATPPAIPDGFAPDYLLLALNVALLWLVVWRAARLGRARTLWRITCPRSPAKEPR